MPTEADGEDERSGDGGGDLGDGEKLDGNATELTGAGSVAAMGVV